MIEQYSLLFVRRVINKNNRDNLALKMLYAAKYQPDLLFRTLLLLKPVRICILGSTLAFPQRKPGPFPKHPR